MNLFNVIETIQKKRKEKLDLTELIWGKIT